MSWRKKPASEKTELPTQKRLDKSREKGQVAQSQELGNVVAVVVLVLILAATAGDLVQWLSEMVEGGMTGETDIFLNTDSFLEYLNRKMSSMLVAVLPLMSALFVSGILGQYHGGWGHIGTQGVDAKME